MNLTEESILKTVLPKTGNYFFEKTEVTEVVSQPTPITYSLLIMIYAQKGPIQHVYSKYNITYLPDNFFVRIGDELYVDKEKELKTLLPSYSYFGQKDVHPHLSTLKGSGVVIKNLFFLSRIGYKDLERLKTNVRSTLQVSSAHILSVQESVEVFLKDYQIVFEINTVTSKKVKELEKFLAENKIEISVTDFLHLEKTELSPKIELYIKENTETWLGNSLEIADVSPFYPVSFTNARKEQEKDNIVEKYFPKNKQDQLKQLAFDVRQLIELRYIGSLIVIKNINLLRKGLLSVARENKFQQLDHIFFATLEEVLKKNISESVCKKRKLEYERLLPLHFPKILSNKMPKNTLVSKGVSKGKGKGILIEIENIGEILGDVILYTSVLSPDLVQYFKKIKGIVSEQGGVLSHAAIIARDMHIPVVVQVNLENIGIKIGDTVEIDGEKGTVVQTI